MKETLKEDIRYFIKIIKKFSLFFKTGEQY